MPSEGKIDMRVSGGVLTGVIASRGGAARERAALSMVSYADMVDRGLPSLPGGDESVVVKGVRGCSVFR